MAPRPFSCIGQWHEQSTKGSQDDYGVQLPIQTEFCFHQGQAAAREIPSHSIPKSLEFSSGALKGCAEGDQHESACSKVVRVKDYMSECLWGSDATGSWIASFSPSSWTYMCRAIHFGGGPFFPEEKLELAHFTSQSCRILRLKLSLCCAWRCEPW